MQFSCLRDSVEHLTPNRDGNCCFMILSGVGAKERLDSGGTFTELGRLRFVFVSDAGRAHHHRQFFFFAGDGHFLPSAWKRYNAFWRRGEGGEGQGLVLEHFD